MNRKTYETLELDKILDRLAAYTSFSASEALIRQLEPTADLEEAQRRQQETGEARRLLEERPTLSIGGARDVRPHARNAAVGNTLHPDQLLELSATLQSAGELRHTLERVEDRFPLLGRMAGRLDGLRHLVDEINRVVSDEGQIQDSASPKLAQLRGDLRLAHDRLRAKLQGIISGQSAAYLQEALITIRGGRYVIPVKAEYRGRIKGIVHDQSSSGATLFIEPLATVEINNQVRELELAEQEEIDRILRELTGLIGVDAERIVWTVEALADLDAAFAKAQYASAIRANPPQLVGFDPKRIPGSTIQLFEARHPLLDPQTVVPIDVALDEATHILIITGPNTGGKTVSLKTVGLLALMAQCGLHLPVGDATLTVFQSIYADIGDEQSIEQSLSTFSAHMRTIIGVLEQSDHNSLVLLDELGSGTDPGEGSAIARAILNDLLQRGVTTFVATHYPELKTYAHGTPGVRNASVEFNVETLSPTYHLIIGLPGRSNALAIAERLGLPHPIIEAARAYVGEADLQTDALLDEIHRTREEIRLSQSRLSDAEAEAVRLRDELRERLAEIEMERQDIIGGAREEARAELDALKAEIGELRRRLRTVFPAAEEAAAGIRALKEIEAGAAEAEAALDAPIETGAEPVPAPPEPLGRRPVQIGDRVFVPNLNAEGEVLALREDGQSEVQIGAMRVRVETALLERRAGAERGEDRREREIGLPEVDSPGMELHLRGFTVEEALDELDEYLDRAYLAGLPFVRIVHGKGTGALRKAIRAALKQHSLVREFHSGGDAEGGEGVTVVTMAIGSER